MANAGIFLVLLATLADAFSQFAFPGQRFGASSAFDPFGHSGIYDHHNIYAFEEPHLPPCPTYRPIELSEWVKVPGGYKMYASLPGVRPSDQRAQLSSDGQTIDILGFRQVPKRGHAWAHECLPRNAKLSRDSRFEILEASARVPFGDISRATMRQTGYGLDITVPQWPMRERKSFRAQDIPQPKPHLKLEAKPTAVPEVPLPPSDGIEVIEEEYDYPEKDADAAEGWIDMRGEFQSY
ncbi:unnamed protein product [Durusdinium trenchii]|uniref:Uncharacterized protein n=3 Tax=Durusdinium trenchii TaxID=1381693 RepID=A0ABP0N5F3_9DINO